MALLYRAIWEDRGGEDPLAQVAQARALFSAWALGVEGETLADGTHNVGEREIILRSVGSTDDGTEDIGFEGIVRDGHTGAGDLWTTNARVLSAQNSLHIAVENLLDSQDLGQRIKVGRPRVVSDLLRMSVKPMLGGSRVPIEQMAVEGGAIAALVDHLRDPSRSLPVIVFTEPRDVVGPQWLTRAEQTARRVEGVARVVTLDHSSVGRFRDALGDLAVWGGGVRTYAPAPLDGPADSWRHRFITPRETLALDRALIDRIVFAVTQMSTRRRLPPVFSAFDSGSGPAAREWDKELESLEFERDLLRDEHDSVTLALARLTGRHQRLVQALRERGDEALVWETHDAPADEIPDVVSDMTEAVLMAQEHLTDALVLPDSAPRDLADLDTAPEATAWANTAWRGLRALAAYARAKGAGATGSFWEWCAGGPEEGWPATTKKLAMRESETVANNEKYRRAREFAIDPRVDASGVQYMEAHLKVSEGGGDLAPRIYFHDGTGGSTGKVHVGFVGPHRLVPNTKS
jgi:hypothetical protein